MSRRGWFLLVTADEHVAFSVNSQLQRYGVSRRAASMNEAVSLLSGAQQWSGLVLDLDGLGRDALHQLELSRKADPLVSILVIASSADSHTINAAHRQRAELITKPFAEEHAAQFAQRALVAGWVPDSRVTSWVDELSQRHRLTAREVQLMAYAIGNEPRAQVMRRLGITENTLKTQVRTLLRKCGARTMDNLAKNVLRDALLLEYPSMPDLWAKGAEEVVLERSRVA